MTERDRLTQAVVEAARVLNSHIAAAVSEGQMPDLPASHKLAAALDALPAPAAAPGEVVEVRGSVWQYPRDKTLFLAGVDQDFDGWPKVADVVVRVPLPRVTEVVGEVEG